MEKTTPRDLSFSEWAVNTYSQKREILELMLNSDNILDRIMAEDIIKTVKGV